MERPHSPVSTCCEDQRSFILNYVFAECQIVRLWILSRLLFSLLLKAQPRGISSPLSCFQHPMLVSFRTFQFSNWRFHLALLFTLQLPFFGYHSPPLPWQPHTWCFASGSQWCRKVLCVSNWPFYSSSRKTAFLIIYILLWVFYMEVCISQRLLHLLSYFFWPFPKAIVLVLFISFLQIYWDMSPLYVTDRT